MKKILSAGLILMLASTTVAAPGGGTIDSDAGSRRTIDVVESILSKTNERGQLQYVNGCLFLVKGDNRDCGSSTLKNQLYSQLFSAGQVAEYAKDLSTQDKNQIVAGIAFLVVPGLPFSDARNIAKRWAATQLKAELSSKGN